MSIYSTNWILKFPHDGMFDGDTDGYIKWLEIICKIVPAHIGSPTPGFGYEDYDPYREFLPPALNIKFEGYDSSKEIPRAVVIVDENTRKNKQQYINPLLILTGEEYVSLTFDDLLHRICLELKRRTLSE